METGYGKGFSQLKHNYKVLDLNQCIEDGNPHILGKS